METLFRQWRSRLRLRPLLGAWALLLALGAAAPARATTTTISTPVSGPITINAGDEVDIVTGGSVTVALGTAVTVNGGTLDMSGGTISGQNDGVDLFVVGSVNISGGTISGGGAGVRVGGGTVGISGGSISSVGVSGGTVSISGGSISDGVAVLGGAATISGGSISGFYGVLVNGGMATVSGGTISGSIDGVLVNGGTVSISGGTISGGVFVEGGTVSISGGTISGGVGVGGSFFSQFGTLNIFGCNLFLSGGRLTGTLQDGTRISTTASATPPGVLNLNNQVPQITCPGAVMANTDAGQCTASGVVLATPTASGGCGVVSVTNDAPTTFAPGMTTVTWTATDAAGDQATCKQIVTVKDTEKPTFTNCPTTVTTAMAACTAKGTGALVSFSSLSATDNCGTPTVTYDHASGAFFPLGNTPVTATAADAAGNAATCAFTVSVAYAWSGVLQPINPNGSSVFKLGSTVPVKFQLTGPSACITTATATLSATKVSSSVAGSVNKAVSTSAATTGSQFRYEPTSGQYVFNWGTKGLTAGTYQLQIDLGDGVTRTVNLGLK